MAKDEHLAMLRRGSAVWNSWRAGHAEAPDLSGGALRGLDLGGYDLARVDLSRADLRGTQFRDANLAGANLSGANLFKAVLDGADLSAALLTGAQFLNCAQLVSARNWASAFRDDDLACGATVPKPATGLATSAPRA